MLTKLSTHPGHDGAVYALERGMNTNEFYSGGSDRVVSLWDLTGELPPQGLVNVGSIIYSLRLIPEMHLLVIGVSSGAFHVIDLKEKKEIRLIKHHTSGIFDCVYSLKHNKLFLCSGDGSISAWSLPDFGLIKTVGLCKEKVRGLAINSDESLLAVACGDGSIRIFDTDTFSQVKDFAAHQASSNCVAFHPENNYMLSGGRDAMLRVWDAKNFTLLKEIPAHNYAIYSISFSPDKKFFATGSRDKTLKIWNAGDQSFLFRADKEKADGHTHSVNKTLWTNYKNVLLSGGDDRKVISWDVVSSK